MKWELEIDLDVSQFNSFFEGINIDNNKSTTDVLTDYLTHISPIFIQSGFDHDYSPPIFPDNIKSVIESPGMMEKIASIIKSMTGKSVTEILQGDKDKNNDNNNLNDNSDDKLSKWGFLYYMSAIGLNKNKYINDEFVFF